MISNTLDIFWYSGFFVVMLFVIGMYYVIFTRNLIRALIGLEILMKAVTLLIIVAGFVSGRTALAQTMVITLIVIEVIVIAVAVGVVLGIHNINNSLDTKKITNLKG